MNVPPPQPVPLVLAIIMAHRPRAFRDLVLHEAEVRLMRYLIQRPLQDLPSIEAAMPLCRQVLIEQHPYLEGIRVPTPEQTRDWVYLWAWEDRKRLRYGAEIMVHPVDARDIPDSN